MTANTPLIQRRRLLKLGLGATVLLGVAGAGVALLKPGLVEGRLSAPASSLMRAVAAAVFEGLLPADAAAREARLDAHMKRLNDTLAGLPPALRAELSQVLALLCSSGGRLALTGLASDWASATPAEVQATLKTMSLSTLDVRQQIYHALRDLNTLVFFTDPASWALVGYPGPREMP
ncbi:hypothetical protein RQP53_13545 [Paucibacter sp. APW11]|uniref:Twin-arginine translocation pathway signal protein n=1 Tax=Roseateles aquae TaxID=3077235 RepID=A0ABU3PDU6_9BURK|nr:hypothetical protein [Paucibacter sp. APW11]MDT9000292.1 hypothetical protein [Paucibacter sp. APW11]